MRPFTGLPRELIALCTLLLATAAAAYLIQRALSPGADETAQSIDSISIAWEREFKEGIKKLIANDALLVQRDELDEALSELLQHLEQHIEEHPYEIEIVVVNSPLVNAMAFPGGLIVFYAPLIRLTETPEELAAIMAHEIGHVVHRDPLRKLIRQIGLSATLAIFGGESTAILEDLIKNLLDLKYSRDQEREADDFALQTLVASGIDPAHFASIMQKLSTGKTNGNDKVFTYLSTHPHLDERVTKARQASEHFATHAEPLGLDWPRVKRMLPSVFD